MTFGITPGHVARHFAVIAFAQNSEKVRDEERHG
jgi:hypothetical protein